MAEPDDRDPRRWLSLVIITASVFMVSLDNNVLIVAMPTMLHDFHTTLSSLQWVITGYSLVFASLLIIGGRLGDLYGHRRTFIIGAALFGAGSLVAVVSQSVPQLILGEAIIEGFGAALMLPNTLALLSITFTGHERATAFGIWGTVSGAAGAFGPVIGGWLTTSFSWRWAFGANVIIAPIAIAGALAFMPKHAARRRVPLDVRGAILASAGMFLLVFALSQGSSFGWLVSIRDITWEGTTVWRSGWRISPIPAVVVAAAAVFAVFVVVERRKERDDGHPLFEFGQLRHRGFKIGLGVSVLVTLGQSSLALILAIFLQGAHDLSAQENGLWQMPVGLSVLVGAQVAGRLARRVDLSWLIRGGILASACGLLYIAMVISPTLAFGGLLPALVVFGFGFGVFNGQLSNLVLSDVDPAKSGVAGGANATARQVGMSLGIAVTGSMITAQTISSVTRKIRASPELAEPVSSAAVGVFRSGGVRFDTPPGTSEHDAGVLRGLFRSALADGARAALLFAGTLLLIGFVVSLRLPKRPPQSRLAADASPGASPDPEVTLGAAH